MRSYDPKEGRYKDQSIGDTPKIYTIPVDGQADQGGRRRLQERRLLRPARLGRDASLDHTPIYTGPPTYPLSPEPDRRMLALPSCIGGLQTGLRDRRQDDLHQRHRRHPAGVAGEAGRQRRAADGRARGRHQPRHADRALAARAAEGRLARRAAAEAGVHRRRRPGRLGHRRRQRRRLLHRPSPAASSSPSTPPRARCSRRSTSGPVWSGPSVSRGRVYVGTGNTLFTPVRLRGLLPQEVHRRALLLRPAGRGRGRVGWAGRSKPSGDPDRAAGLSSQDARSTGWTAADLTGSCSILQLEPDRQDGQGPTDLPPETTSTEPIRSSCRSCQNCLRRPDRRSVSGNDDPTVRVSSFQRNV